MSDVSNIFGQVEETIQKKRIKKAGIYQKAKLASAEFVEKGPEKDKKGYKAILLTFQIPDEGDIAEFEHRIFEPALKKEDRTYERDKWEKGVKIRKMTFEEQREDDLKRRFIEFVQLKQALGLSFEQAKKELMDSISGCDVDTVFSTMAKAVAKEYEKGHTAFIDIKILWQNSTTKRTSQLAISEATTTNLAYAAHHEKSKLQFTDREVKDCLKPRYTGQNNPPLGSEPLSVETVGGQSYMPEEGDGMGYSGSDAPTQDGGNLF